MHTLVDVPVSSVRGVGPAVAKLLAKLRVHSVSDLLQHYPRAYDDRTQLSRIAELRSGQAASFRGTVRTVDERKGGRSGIHILRVMVEDGQTEADLVFFGQPFLGPRFAACSRDGKPIEVHGHVQRSRFGRLEVMRSEWSVLPAGLDSPYVGSVMPVHRSTDGLSASRLRTLVRSALDQYLPAVTDPIPASVLGEIELISRHEALRAIHCPSGLDHLAQARRRLVFEELLFLMLSVQQQVSPRQSIPDAASGIAGGAADELQALVPYRLTDGQRQAIIEICTDLAAAGPTSRLLQGDVGSGKTAVAAGAALFMTKAGYQTALMAPTELLAEQHSATLAEILGEAGLQVVCLTGGMPAMARKAALDDVRSGKAAVAVGTHALLEDRVTFQNLGLALVDEQHRFGVEQRSALRAKVVTGNLIVMTATPIPRTLAMTLYADLVVTSLRDQPPGRSPVRTHWKRAAQRPEVYAGVRKLLDKGRQAFVVCPVIEQSDQSVTASAKQVFEAMSEHHFGSYRVGLLHGAQPSEAKRDVMSKFRAGDVDVLVSTTVIEVGVDIPNAVVMVVEDADRFGLAQLHQLRGRVGRGVAAGYCVLISDPSTVEAEARLRTLVETSDGYRIAEEDLRIRGPGELYGLRQSGVPELRLADLAADGGLATLARQLADDVMRPVKGSQPDDYQALRHEAALRQAQVAKGSMDD